MRFLKIKLDILTIGTWLLRGSLVAKNKKAHTAV